MTNKPLTTRCYNDSDWNRGPVGPVLSTYVPSVAGKYVVVAIVVLWVEYLSLLLFKRHSCLPAALSVVHQPTSKATLSHLRPALQHAPTKVCKLQELKTEPIVSAVSSFVIAICQSL